MQPTFVLVHGAFSNSFAFAPLQAELGLLGHRSVAVDQPRRTRPAPRQLPHRESGRLAAFKAAFLADGTDEQFLTFLNTFQPDENLDVGTSADRAQADTWGRIPKTYVRLADDTSLPLAMQDRLIREGDALTPDNPYDVRTLEGSHLKWLVDSAAKRLGYWANSQR